MRIEVCKRCGKDWCFYGSGRPVRCGRCKSPYWDIERQGGHVGSSVGDGEKRSVVGGSGVHASVGSGRAKEGVARVGVSLPDGEVDALPKSKAKDRSQAKPSDTVAVPVSGRMKAPEADRPERAVGCPTCGVPKGKIHQKWCKEKR